MKNILRKLYFALIYRFTNKTFPIFQTLGLHLIPNHHYQPVPDTRKLKGTLFSGTSDLIGIRLNEQEYFSLLEEFSRKYKNEYMSFPENKTSSPHQFYRNNIAFGPVDAEILYSMIRHFHPQKIIEIGSGFSTYLSAQAILKNREKTGEVCELIAIEPYPNPVLKRGFPGLSKLIQSQVQDVPISEFKVLGLNDILFIDSSHVLKIGSDVQYEFLEILSRLQKGVIIHIHDIFMPAEYPRKWIFKDKRFYTEQYLLQAFLTFNEHFEVIWPASYMHLHFPEMLESAFHSYNKLGNDIPCSFWIRRVE